jgi:endoglucanase
MCICEAIMKQVLTAAVVFCCALLGCTQEQSISAIKLDQVGYLTSAEKVAVVTAPAHSFVVKRAVDGKVVFEGKLSAAAKDADTGDTVQSADFTKLRQPGKYYLEVPGVGSSWRFSIGPDAFSRTYYLAMRAFYGQRCGIAVDLGPEFPGYKYPACHLKGAFNPSSGKEGNFDDPGGWHDAGDFGRYIPSSAVTVASLMWTHEMYGAKTNKISLKIPESGNGTPDLLNETRWNLNWMLNMQDTDGGVWHKQTSPGFAGFIMPQDDKAVSEVIGTGSDPYKSTCATADLAAVGAMAARVYRPYDAAFAARNLEAARKAWKWALAHPNVTFKNPKGVHTGEYPDGQCGDEILWASAELWHTTGEAEFNKYFTANYSKFIDKMQSPPPENWAEMSPFAAWGYLLSGRKGDAKATAEVRKAIVDGANEIVKRTRSNAYRTSMIAKDYVWGSNSVAAQYSMQLLITNRIAPNPAYVEVAVDNLHYILGRNAFSMSWLTQVGDNPFKHPHHRPSEADKLTEPWPGLISGGPNAHWQDAELKIDANTPPAKSWADKWQAAPANEVAINWQGVLVFVLAGQLQ